MKLICGGNPVALGIADEQGNWDYEKFKEHVHNCDKCSGFAMNLMDGVKGVLNG